MAAERQPIHGVARLNTEGEGQAFAGLALKMCEREIKKEEETRRKVKKEVDNVCALCSSNGAAQSQSSGDFEGEDCMCWRRATAAGELASRQLGSGGAWVAQRA